MTDDAMSEWVLSALDRVGAPLTCVCSRDMEAQMRRVLGSDPDLAGLDVVVHDFFLPRVAYLTTCPDDGFVPASAVGR